MLGKEKSIKKIATMKTKTFFVLLLSLLAFACGGKEEPKILIAYYSQSGNTRAVAEQIEARFGGDLFEITLVEPYPADERETIELAGKHREEGIRPMLGGRVENIDEYDIVFLGTPIWFGTAALPVFSFVEAHDLGGKTIVPFYTCGRGNEGTFVEDVKALCGDAVFLDSFGNTRPEREAGVHIAKVDSLLRRLSF